MYFEYGSKEIEYLKNRNELLGAAIDGIGHIHRVVDGDAPRNAGLWAQKEKGGSQEMTQDEKWKAVSENDASYE